MKQRLGALVLVASVSFFSGGWLLHRNGSAEGDAYQQARILETVLSVIHEHSLDSPDHTELFQKAARKLVDELKDPYAELLIGEDYRRFHQQLSGTGEVTAPAGAPASAPAGTADGAAAEGGRPRVAAVSPEVMLTATTGYVALHSLSDGSVQELETAVWQLRQRGMQTLVLDLRNNSGGLIKQAVKVAELFLAKGDTIATTRGRSAAHTKTYVASTGPRWPGLSLVLLVNDGTASSAELIAGALQDHDRAVVIGQATYGKGVLQTTYPLGNEMALKLTTARWFTPSGRSINKPRTRADSILADQRRAAQAKGFRYRSDAGRALTEGQGIIPDLAVRRGVYTPGERAFLDTLGAAYAAFRSALAEGALNARADANLVDENFVVTPEMRERVYAAMASQGVHVPREIFEGAAAYVDRQLGYEIARELFGDTAATRRRLLDDRQMRVALELSRRASTQDALIRLAAEGLD